MTQRDPIPPIVAYQLKITLENFSPLIWRRVQVLGSITLAELHQVIQIAMGWMGGHLHQFSIDGTYYGSPSSDDYYPVRDERAATLADVAPTEKIAFTYEYDFGDSWEHLVLVEKILQADPAQSYPVCLKGQRACPPEDVGGVWGYTHFLEAMADPNHPDHVDLKEWSGGAFDPEQFDARSVNRSLAALAR